MKPLEVQPRQSQRFILVPRWMPKRDVNLVLYWSGGPGRWASNTNGHAVSKVVMQGYGNFVIYAQDRKTLVWASGTNGHPRRPANMSRQRLFGQKLQPIRARFISNRAAPI